MRQVIHHIRFTRWTAWLANWTDQVRVPLSFAFIQIPLKHSHENEAHQAHVFMTTIKEVHFLHVTQKVHPELCSRRDKNIPSVQNHYPSKPHYFLRLWNCFLSWCKVRAFWISIHLTFFIDSLNFLSYTWLHIEAIKERWCNTHQGFCITDYILQPHFYLLNIVVSWKILKPTAVFWSTTTSFQFFDLLLKIHTYDWQLLQKNPDEMTVRHNALLPSSHFQCRSLCEVALVWLQTLKHTERSVELWLLGCC